MPDRRAFLASLAGASFAPGAVRQLLRAEDVAGTRAADDEAYWSEIQRAFDVDRTMVNLNNAGISPTPGHVLDQMIRDLRFTNQLPTEHMWRVLEPRVESVRRELAKELGCDAEELAITRNASEANMTMIFGTDLQRGDEVIVTTQNYPRMLNAWRQRERRDGIVLRAVKIPTPVPNEQTFVDHIARAITPRTKVIEVMHVSWQTGYVAPVRQIVDLARPKGITVFVDGAHAFAHFPFTRDELGCDLYGTSLHKWLHAPIGTGFLYVRRDRIKSLWPMMSGTIEQEDNIRKYEEIGTHPAANHNAIAVALAFHRSIGAERKIARLRYLRDRWAKQVLASSDRAHLITPIGPNESGAIAVLAVDGMDMAKLGGWLLANHRIVTTPIVNDEFQGIRITPSIYTTVDEVDLFAKKVVTAIRSGVS
jgi:isopenicillin-N epimerase